MKIEPKKIKIRELISDYKDNNEEGVLGYNGKLNIRPPYQREFIYDDKKRKAVIDTVFKGHPLNSIYWAVTKDNKFEVIDGQQRIISICQYCSSDFSIDGKYFHSLQVDQKEKILDYVLTVYFCSGKDSEKLEWFETINIAGEVLTDQELKNATFSGPWVTDAKRYFSKNGCVAYKKAADYLNGKANRQDYLETAIAWISNGKIEEHMSSNHHKDSAKDLWNYFETVINWVEKTFVKKRKFMKGLQWGVFYNKYKDKNFDPKKIEKSISELIQFSDKIKMSGIYEFILTGEPKHLMHRKFPDNIKHKVYENQKGKCQICKKSFEISEMEADHIKAWFDSGETIAENCQMLCRECHYSKTAEQTKTLKAKLNL